MTQAVSRILATDENFGAFWARVALGGVMLPHGLQKTIGWFGGYGFSPTMQFFTETMGIPWLLALAAVLAESAGALLLIAGLASRLSAAAVGATMIVAALSVHASNGIFMNWTGRQAGEGFEFHILAVALAVVVLVLGGGRYSADRRLTAWLASRGVAATRRFARGAEA